MPNCNYQFLTGAKKGTPCNRLIRGKDSNLCYQHKAKTVKLEQPIKEEPISQTPMKTKGKPIKINDPDIKKITTKTEEHVPIKRVESKPIEIVNNKDDESFEELPVDSASSSSSDSYSISDSSSDLDTSSDSD